MIPAPARVLAWASALCLIAGCITVPEFRHLERQVAELQKGGSGSGARVGERLADLGAEMEALHDEIAQLRGELEETRHLAEQALAEAGAAAAPRASEPAPGTPADGGAAAARGGGAAAARGGGAAAAARGGSAEIREYEEAFRLYRSGDYQTAVDRFRGFLQTHPSSDYADNALFWMGECYFKLGDHEQAVLTFAEVVELYPDGNKVPDALYRQGSAMLELGESSGKRETYEPAAREVFKRIVVQYPDSERVGEAQRQLEKLKQ